MKTKTLKAVANKLRELCRELAFNPNAPHAKVFKNISIEAQHRWTEAENKRFAKVLQ